MVKEVTVGKLGLSHLKWLVLYTAVFDLKESNYLVLCALNSTPTSNFSHWRMQACCQQIIFVS